MFIPTKMICRALIPLSTFACSLLMGSGSIYAQETTEQTFARYARYGADVWSQNPTARISGESKACVSCHTSLPYALVEPLLPGDYGAYRELITNIDERVRSWQDNTPWYAGQKTEQIAGLNGLPPHAMQDFLDADGSRGVEAIFNAFILAIRDAYSNAAPAPETRLAFDNMWAAQIPTGDNAGSWNWIKVNLIPWEVEDSDLWGASLACVAASRFPELAPNSHRELLYARLRRGAQAKNTSLHVKAAMLWCDSETGGRLLEPGMAARIVADLLELQFSNGGWAIRQLGPWVSWEGSSSDCCAQRELRPDAYATGYVTFVLAASRHLLGADGLTGVAKAREWIEATLADPYPAEPRHNRHESAEAAFPKFRNNIYTNAGHMWAFLAMRTLEDGRPPWSPARGSTQASMASTETQGRALSGTD